jgi:aspartate/tyrosine/aromatic aminotransferase
MGYAICLHRSLRKLTSNFLANHNAIISNVGLNPVSYPYYNPKTIDLDFEGFVKSIESMPERSVILLHSCAHNPTVSELKSI